MQKRQSSKRGSNGISHEEEINAAKSVSLVYSFWKQGLKLLLEAIDQAGHTGKILIGSDPASSEFWKGEEQKYAWYSEYLPVARLAFF